MINIIRADIYRILRGKALYITLILLAATSVLVSSGSGTVGIASGLLIGTYESGEVEPTGGIAALTKALSDSDILIYFLIPMFMTVCVTMFSHNTVKNELSAGVSRTRLYGAKLLLSTGLCLLLTLFYPLAVWLSGCILHGWGGPYTAEYIGGLFRIIGAQGVILLAFTGIGVFLSFVTRRAAAVNGAYIAIALGPLVLIGMVSLINQEVMELVKYDLTGCIKTFAYINQMPAGDMVRGLATGAVYLVLSTAAGMVLFQRAEIK